MPCFLGFDSQKSVICAALYFIVLNHYTCLHIYVHSAFQGFWCFRAKLLLQSFSGQSSFSGLLLFQELNWIGLRCLLNIFIFIYILFMHQLRSHHSTVLCMVRNINELLAVRLHKHNSICLEREFSIWTDTHNGQDGLSVCISSDNTSVIHDVSITALFFIAAYSDVELYNKQIQMSNMMHIFYFFLKIYIFLFIHKTMCKPSCTLIILT